MNRRNYLSLLLAGLLVLFLLAACSGKTETPPDNSTGGSQDGNSGQSSGEDQSGTLRLLLPEGPSADACAVYERPVLSDDMRERADALATGSADIVSLSPQTAADLFRSGTEVQVIAVSAPGDRDVPDSMECLVALRSWLEENPEQADTFLTQFAQAVPQVEGAYLATGWDMMDLVQADLEAQYIDAPSPDRTVPDSSFFYLPEA